MPFGQISIPRTHLNSLNQTVYFLRRVFEPTFQEDLSPGYLNHEGDVLGSIRASRVSCSSDAGI